jgi:hypothetical protein
MIVSGHEHMCPSCKLGCSIDGDENDDAMEQIPMADDNISVKITGVGRPSSIGGGTTPSFASSSSDANPRAIIRADKGIVDSQNKLADQIRELRVAMRRTAEDSRERTALTRQVSELRAMQRANVGARSSADQPSRNPAPASQPAAQRPSLGLNTLRSISRSIVGALRETWAGNPMGAIGHVFRGGSSAIGMRAMAGSGAGSAATDAAGSGCFAIRLASAPTFLAGRH